MLPTGVAWSGEVSGAIDWTWNHSFELASETIAGEAITFSYDDDGLLAGAGPLTIDRDPANGRITGSTLGTTTDEYVYDSEGRLETYVARQGMSEVLQQIIQDANKRED